MTRKLPPRSRLVRKSAEQVRMIKFMATAQYGLALRSAGISRHAWIWMSSPHPGDIVVETTSAHRRPDDLSGVGVLRSFSGHEFEIETLHDGRNIRWTNASIIRPICTRDDSLVAESSSYAVADAVRRRAYYKPWCRLERDVSFEDLGLDADEWTRLLRCRGCGEVMRRRRFSDDNPMCPTCHIPEPEPTPCPYCKPGGRP